MTNSNLISYSTPFHPTQLKQIVSRGTSIQGLLVAACILSLWSISSTFLLSINIATLPLWLIPILVLCQTFLYTGLFITAHDAMHGAIFPNHPKINTLIGKLAVSAYGLLSYQVLLHKHWLHHRHPASDLDPDFHDGTHKNPIAWYFHFMKGYWSWRQLVGFTVLYQAATLVLQISEPNLFLFWLAPLSLSSLQLFYFGTYLTHREPPGGYTGSHRAKTNPLPVFWSFLACYHFGYHEEHHEYPQAAWWQLSAVHQLRTNPELRSEKAPLT